MRHAVVTMRLAWGRECGRCRQRGEREPAYGIPRPTGLRLCDACWEVEPEDLKRKMTACYTTYQCPWEVVKSYPDGFGHTVLPPQRVFAHVHVPECPFYEARGRERWARSWGGGALAGAGRVGSHSSGHRQAGPPHRSGRSRRQRKSLRYHKLAVGPRASVAGEGKSGLQALPLRP